MMDLSYIVSAVNSFSYCDSLNQIILPKNIRESISIDLPYSFTLDDCSRLINSIDSSNCSTDTTTYTYYRAYDINYICPESAILPSLTYYPHSIGLSSLPSCSYDGYTFAGWYTDSTYSTKVESISSTQTGDITLYAKFLCDINLEDKTYEFTYLDDNIKYTPVYSTALNESINFKVEYLVNGEYTTTIPTNQGSYKVRVTREEDDTYSAFTYESSDYALIINKRDINNTTLETTIINKPYTGSPITQEIVLTYKGVKLIENTDYTLNYINNTNIGTAYINIEGIGNYKELLYKDVDQQIKYSFEIYSVSVEIPDDGTIGTPSNPSDDDEIIISDGEYELNIQVEYNSIPYNFNVQKPTITVYIDKQLIPESNYTVIYSNENSTNCGKHTVSVYSSSDNIQFDKVVFNYEITKININDVTDNSIINNVYSYTGEEIKPEINLEYLNTTLTKDTDYTLEYSNNINVGQASIKITGINNFEGELSPTKTFTIVKNVDSVGTLDVYLNSELNEFVYTGNLINPDIIVKYAGQTRTDYTTNILEINPINVGTYTLTVIINPVNENGLYATGTVEFKIIPSNLEENEEETIEDGENEYTYTDSNNNELNISISDTSYSYNFKVQKPEVIVTLNGYTISNNDLNIVYSDSSVNVGTYTVKVSADNDNIKFNEITFTYEITKININDIIDESSISSLVIYTGNPITQIISYKYLNRKLVENTDYTVNYSDNTNIGTCVITISGINNFEGTIVKEFKIVKHKEPVKLEYYLSNNIFKYDGNIVNINNYLQVYYNGFQRQDFSIIIYDENNNIIEEPSNIGTYKLFIEINSSDIYGQIETSFEIVKNEISLNEEDAGYSEANPYLGKELVIENQDDLNVTITLDYNEFTYNFDIQNPNVTIIINNKELSTDLYNVVTVESKDSGEYILKIYADNDSIYLNNIYFKYTIKQIELRNDMLISSIENKYFTGYEVLQDIKLNDSTYTYDLIKNTDYTITYSDNTNVGTAKVSIEGNNNYKGTLEYEFNILKVVIDKTLESGDLGSASKPISNSEEFTLKDDNNSITIKISYYSINYTSKVLKPEVEVYLNDNKLASNYYLITSQDSINSGLYTISIKADNDNLYFDSVSFNYVINKVNVRNTTKDYTIQSSVDYTGSSIEPVIKLKLGDYDLTINEDYSVTYSNNKEIGTATITVRGIGDNFSGSFKEKFEIVDPESNKIKLNITFEKELTYNGNNLELLFKVYYEETEITDYSYTIYDENNDIITNLTNAGTYKLNVHAQVNGIDAFKSIEFKVMQVTLTDDMLTSTIEDKKYTGDYIYQDIVLKYLDNTLLEDTDKDNTKDYTIEYTNNLEIGTAHIVITGINNYTGTLEYDFLITGPDLEELEVILNSSTYEYTGSNIEYNYTVSLNNEELNLDDYEDYLTINVLQETEKVNPINVGVYTLEIIINSKLLYAKGTAEFTITPADINNVTIEGFKDSIVYTGSEITQNLTLIYNGITLDSNSYEITYSNNINAGTAVITITGSNNFNGTNSQYTEFTITPANIEDVTIVGFEGNIVYTGTAITQYITLKYNGITLIESTEYELTYSNNTNVGTATLTINSKGNFKNNISKEFTITAVSLEKVTIEGFEDSFVYTGTAITQNVTLKYNGNNLVNNTDYTLTYTNNTNVGTATLTITGKGNYSSYLDKTFTIEKADINNVTIQGFNDSIEYTGSEITQNIILTYNGITLDSNCYELTYSNNTNVGTATLTITGKGNYSSSLDKTFTIEQADINNVNVEGVPERVLYTGSAITFTDIKVTYNNIELSNEDYEITYSNNINVGTASITFEGKGNFKDTKVVEFIIVISNVPEELEVIVDPSNYTYTGKKVNYLYSIKYHDQELDLSILNENDITVTISKDDEEVDPINVGEYKLTVLINNSSIYAEGSTTFTIVKNEFKNEVTNPYDDLNVTLSNDNYELIISLEYKSTSYNSTEQKPKITINLNDITLDSSNYNIIYSGECINQGNYTITVSPLGDNISFNDVVFNYTINKATLNDNLLKSTIEDKIYTGSEITQEIIIEDGNYKLIVGTDYEVVYSNNINAGVNTASFTITGCGNYSGSITKTFTITQVNIENITIDGFVESIKYTGSAITQNITLTYNDMTLEGLDYTLTYQNNINVNSDNYIPTLVIEGNGNYTGSITKTFTITPADINEVTVEGVPNTTPFTGSEITFNDIKLTYYENELSVDKDYTIEYLSNVEVGTATIKFSGNGNFENVKEVTFKIVISDVAEELEIILDQDEFKYNGNVVNLTYSVMYHDAEIDLSSYDFNDITIEILQNKTNLEPINIGTYTLHILISNSTIYAEGSATFTIVKNEIPTDSNSPTPENPSNDKDLIIGDDNNKIQISLEYNSKSYNFEEQKPSIKVTLNGYEISSDNYTVSYSGDCINAGEYTITVIANGDNISFNDVSFKYVISKVTLNDDMLQSIIIDKEYTGEAITQEIVLEYLSKTLIVNTDYEVTYSNNINAGQATVTITGIDNFEGDITKTFNIISPEEPKDQILELVDDSIFKYYRLVEAYDEDGEVDYYLESYIRTEYKDGEIYVLGNIPHNISINKFLTQFKQYTSYLNGNCSFKVYDYDRELIDEEGYSDVIGSNYIVEYYIDDKLCDKIYISVLGDLNFYGFALADDYSVIDEISNATPTQLPNFDLWLLVSADVTKDGYIDVDDVSIWIKYYNVKIDVFEDMNLVEYVSENTINYIPYKQEDNTINLNVDMIEENKNIESISYYDENNTNIGKKSNHITTQNEYYCYIKKIELFLEERESLI